MDAQIAALAVVAATGQSQVARMVQDHVRTCSDHQQVRSNVKLATFQEKWVLYVSGQGWGGVGGGALSLLPLRVGGALTFESPALGGVLWVWL